MNYGVPLTAGVLLRRYKRFLADVRLADDRVLTVHTPNTGAMLGCAEPGSRVWIRDSGNPARKYPHTWEIVESPAGALVGINPALANTLVAEAVAEGGVPELAGYGTLRREVRFGREGSRVDILLQGHPRQADAWVEVKSVTLVREGVAAFPDAVTTRGARHLRELIAVRETGQRAVLVFCIQRADASRMAPADDIDPAYGRLLREAAAAGVEILAFSCQVRVREPAGIRMTVPVPLVYPRADHV